MVTGQEDTMPEKLGRVYFDLWFKGHQSFNGNGRHRNNSVAWLVLGDKNNLQASALPAPLLLASPHHTSQRFPSLPKLYDRGGPCIPVGNIYALTSGTQQNGQG